MTGPLLGRRVLVVGAGRMARLAALAASRQGARVLVANRSSDRAAALAYDANGEPAAFGADAALPAADAIVLAISARWPLSADARAALLAGSAAGRRPVVAAGPRRRDPGGAGRPVHDASTTSPGARRTSSASASASASSASLDDAEGRYAQWVRARASVPAIQALTDQAEARRAEELDRLFRRADLAEADRELVVQMSHRLVAGLLHAPLVKLRDDEHGRAGARRPGPVRPVTPWSAP